MPTLSRSLLLCALCLAPCLWPASAEASDACGLDLTTLPDFSLEDVNPSSASAGAAVSRSGLEGKVVVAYFALSSCGHCQSQTGQLQDIWSRHAEAFGDDVRFVLVSLASGADTVEELTSRTDLPVLQDTDGDDVAGTWGAEKWFLYIVRPDGTLGTIHYTLNLTEEAVVERLIAEIDAARTGGAL